MKVLIFLLILACSSTPEYEELGSWLGKTPHDLNAHPYFKGLPSTIRGDIYFFEDQTRPHSAAYCASLGGCEGLPIWDCQYLFQVKENRIIEARMTGTCPDKEAKLFPN